MLIFLSVFHCFHNESLHFIAEWPRHRSRPIGFVGVHLVQPLLNFGVAAGKASEQLRPARG